MRSGAGFGWQRTWKGRAGTGEPGKSSCRSRPNHDRPLPCPPACASFGRGSWRWSLLTEAELLARLYELVRIAGEDLEAFTALLGGTEPGP